YVVDAITKLVIGTMPLSSEFGPGQPTGLAVSTDGSRVYATERSGNRLAVFDPVAMAEVASVPVGVHPFLVDVTPDGTRAYVVCENGLTIVDTATNQVVGTLLTVDDYPSAGERFIVPGTSTTTTTSPTSTTTTSTIAALPVLSTPALVCQKALAK